VVCAEHDVIYQIIPIITIISSKSKKFSIRKDTYKSRKLNNKYLYNSIGLNLENGFYKATVERAVADLLYYNPYYFFDGKDLIDWKGVEKIQKEIGYKK